MGWADSIPRARLLARIRKRFDVTVDSIVLADRAFSFTRVTDPDAVLDQVVEAEDRREKLTGQRHASDELHLPYWAELWDSALGIGTFLLSEDRPAGSTALDLGCGMGFAGMIAAAAGFDVLAADLESDALLFAKLNIGGDTRRMNWQTDFLGRRFDLIIGADVLYDKTQWQFLEPFWRNHLTPDGTVLLGEPGRQTGGMFLDWLKGRGWSVGEREQKVSTRDTPIRLFELTRGLVA